jgi:sec-independent protein translocase protein TatA
MPNLRGTEWLIIILLVVLLFGAKRLPDAARSVGRSLRIFKAETKGLVEGETEPADQASSTAGSGTTQAQALPASQPAPPAGTAEASQAAANPQPETPSTSALHRQPPSEA